jgi:hypothetical protein
MRHLGGIAIGFFGTVIGVIVIAAALGLTRRAVEQLTRGPLLIGSALLLIGGAAIGAVAIFGRMSVAAPLTGAAVALLLSVVGVVAPSWPYQLGIGQVFGGGLAIMTSLQVPALLAGVLLLTSLGVAAPRAAAPVGSPAPPPPGGPPTGPLPPYPQQPWGMPQR